MNKKNVGAVIAVASLAGALGVNLYSKYKLIKGDNAQDKDSEVSKEDLDDFDIDEMFGSEADTETSQESDTNEEQETKESAEEDVPSVILDLIEEVEKRVDNEEKVTELFPELKVETELENVKTKDDEKTEVKNEENIDIDNPEFWKEFDNDIEEPKK